MIDGGLENGGLGSLGGEPLPLGRLLLLLRDLLRHPESYVVAQVHVSVLNCQDNNCRVKEFAFASN